MSENGFIPPFSGFSVNCDPDGGNCFFAVNVFKPVTGCPNRLHEDMKKAECPVG